MGSRGIQAVDHLQSFFSRSSHDLKLIHDKLQEEFQQSYPDNVNPLNLVSRVKKIQEDLASLRAQSQDLLSTKQDLIDKSRTILVGNRTLVMRLEACLGINMGNSIGGDAIEQLLQVVEEWDLQVGLRTEKEGLCPEDVNDLILSQKLQNI